MLIRVFVTFMGAVFVKNTAENEKKKLSTSCFDRVWAFFNFWIIFWL